jgi:hypothetical protein
MMSVGKFKKDFKKYSFSILEYRHFVGNLKFERD